MPEQPADLDAVGETHRIARPHFRAGPPEEAVDDHAPEDVQGVQAGQGEINGVKRVRAREVAVVHEDRRYTYREFGERVNRLASALRAGGLQKGDRVAFICPNIPALLEAHYGVPMAGAVGTIRSCRFSGGR